MSPRIRYIVPLLILLVAAILPVACGSDSRTSSAPMADEVVSSKVAASADMAPAPPSAAPSAMRGRAAESAPAGGQAYAPPSSAAADQSAGSNSSMIIRTGMALVEVDSLERAIAAVQRIATALGGWVGSTSLASGENEVRRATIELKIPSARYDEALAGLTPIGKVESVNSNAEDVGEEFVDLTARTANSRRLEERLITLLATRTGKLEDVLNVERELARVREEIERHEGRLRYLRTRVATSTLTVTVHERAPLVSANPGENVIGEAFKDSWRNFVRFVAVFIASLGTIVPLLLLAGLGVMGWRRFRPHRPAGPPPSADTP